MECDEVQRGKIAVKPSHNSTRPPKGRDSSQPDHGGQDAVLVAAVLFYASPGGGRSKQCGALETLLSQDAVTDFGGARVATTRPRRAGAEREEQEPRGRRPSCDSCNLMRKGEEEDADGRHSKGV